MINSVDPEKTVAVVVGIEKYDYGKNWNLNGPGSDAVRFVKWLRKRGVPKERILLFLSLLDDNHSLKQEIDVHSCDATRDVIQHALAQQLNDDSSLRGDLLFLFWGGHGVMEADQRRLLFFANATDHNKLNIDVDYLWQMLRSKERRHRFKYQVGIIDACANYFEEMRHKLSLATCELTSGEADPAIKQFIMYAAAAGERAKNEDVQRTGAFSNAVLQQLENPENSPLNQWPPDMERVNEAVKAEFNHLRKGRRVNQTPVSFQFQDWDGNKNLNLLGNIEWDSKLLWDVSEVRQLLFNLKITTAQFRQMYVRSVPDWQRAPEVFNLDQMITSLSESSPRSEGALTPLLEFVVRIAQSLPPDSPTNKDLMEKVESIWNEEDRAANVIQDLISRIQNERSFTCYLLIDVCDPDLYLKELRFPAQIRYWVVTKENPYGKPGTFSCKSTSESDIRCAILSIIETVASNYGTPVVELFVHHLWFNCNIDQWNVLVASSNPFFDEDESEKTQSRLGDTYPIVLRWGNRAMEANDDSCVHKHTYPGNWRETIKSIKDQNASQPDVFWISQEPTQTDLKNEISEGNNPTCTGFSFIPYNPVIPKNAPLLKALIRGAAYAFWPRHPPDDDNDFKRILSNTVLKDKLENLPRTILELRQQAKNDNSHPGYALTLFWDDPDRNPLTIPTIQPE